MTPGSPLRVVLAGATGTIGRATLHALVRHGHAVTCLVRPGRAGALRWPDGVAVREVPLDDAEVIRARGFGDEPCDAVISCMASRTGEPRDAWAVDHRASLALLQAAQRAGASRFVLLSAICVQKPRLAFQHAKLAFEQALRDSGLTWSIVRPTAYFKSLSGQVERVRRGRPYVMFGDGTRTACKPIGNADLGEYLAGCVTDPARWNRVLVVGGPGPAITPREQGELLFRLAGRPPQFSRVPVWVLDAIITVLSGLGAVVPPLEAKAELARIGRYYATESMLAWDPVAGRYDADATPSFGTETLAAHYERLWHRVERDDRGEHAVF